MHKAFSTRESTRVMKATPSEIRKAKLENWLNGAVNMFKLNQGRPALMAKSGK